LVANYCDYQTATQCSNVKERCSPIREPSPVNEHISHKLVAIGPDHQALIPDCNPTSVNNNDNNSEKWIKYCLSTSCDLDPFLIRNICCDCSDEGSMKCVRAYNRGKRGSQEVVWAREIREVGVL
jgi:hypothetical protein